MGRFSSVIGLRTDVRIQGSCVSLRSDHPYMDYI